MTQGSYASNQGGTLEATVKAIFQRHGFVIIPYSEYKRTNQLFGSELLITNMPYQTIYGHKGKTEFLIISEKYNLNLRVECKWQQSNGSVDEKLPYLYLNCIETMPESHIMIVIDGDGWKKGAIQWLKDAVSEKKYTTKENRDKFIQVFSLKEFMAWANKLFR